MKTTLFAAAASIIMLAGCSSGKQMQSSVGSDDVYSYGSTGSPGYKEESSAPNINNDQENLDQPNLQSDYSGSEKSTDGEGNTYITNNYGSGFSGPSCGMSLSPFYSGFTFYSPFYFSPSFSIGLSMGFGWGYNPWYSPYYAYNPYYMYNPWYSPYYWYNPYGYNPYYPPYWNPYYDGYYGSGYNNGYYGYRGSVSSNTSTDGNGGRLFRMANLTDDNSDGYTTHSPNSNLQLNTTGDRSRVHNISEGTVNDHGKTVTGTSKNTSTNRHGDNTPKTNTGLTPSGGNSNGNMTPSQRSNPVPSNNATPRSNTQQGGRPRLESQLNQDQNEMNQLAASMSHRQNRYQVISTATQQQSSAQKVNAADGGVITQNYQQNNTAQISQKVVKNNYNSNQNVIQPSKAPKGQVSSRDRDYGNQNSNYKSSTSNSSRNNLSNQNSGSSNYSNGNNSGRSSSPAAGGNRQGSSNRR